MVEPRTASGSGNNRRIPVVAVARLVAVVARLVAELVLYSLWLAVDWRLCQCFERAVAGFVPWRFYHWQQIVAGRYLLVENHRIPGCIHHRDAFVTSRRN